MHIVALSYIRAARVPPAARSDAQVHGSCVLAPASVREKRTAAREPASGAPETDASSKQGDGGAYNCTLRLPLCACLFPSAVIVFLDGSNSFVNN